MRITVPLTREEFDQLVTLARTERRRPQDQAAILLASLLGRTVSVSPKSAQASPLEREVREVPPETG